MRRAGCAGGQRARCQAKTGAGESGAAGSGDKMSAFHS
jgi:hypothetical protein